MKYDQAVSHDTRHAIIGALKQKRAEMKALLEPGQLAGIEHQREMVTCVVRELDLVLLGLETSCSPQEFGADLLLTFYEIGDSSDETDTQ